MSATGGETSAVYTWLDAALGEGAQVVTAGRRLARDLLQAHGARQLEAGHAAWRTPRIVPWEAWLDAQLLQDDARAPRRLHPQASAVLWEHCLESAGALDVLDPAGLVRQAVRCWQRLNEWCVSHAELAPSATTEDERRFAAAAAAYRRELDAGRWVDTAGLPACVAEALLEERVPAPARLVLAGFDRAAPAVARVMDALERRGCRVSMAPLPAPRARPRVARCADPDAERRAAGAWARERLLRAPAARVAVVWPGLEQDAARAGRLLREGFAPGWQAGSAAHGEAVQVSYGGRLAEYPLIARALLWLRWTGGPLSSREVSILLRAPFPGHPGVDGASRLELALRALPERRWSAANLAAALRGRDAGEDAEVWLARVETVAAAGLAGGASDSPAAWAARVHGFLEAIGWPGRRTLDSPEFQVVNRWRELLNEFTRIEPVRPRLGYPEALSRILRAAGETVFQPDSGPGRVQLLGVLEASGLELDHVWIGNLHALQWPPPAHPLPLVSRALQRRAGMPDATPADAVAFARRTLARLVAAAPSVVLSWPAADGDALHAPSSLLAAYADPAAEDVPDPGWYAASPALRAPLEEPAPDRVPRVQADERIAEGAGTVRQQAVEPFAAFARGRLRARALERFAPGLGPGTTGRIIHDALRRLLAERPASAELASWRGEERATRIAAAVDGALAAHERHADALLRRLLALERLRLRALLDRFLDAETARRPFAVASVETELTFTRHDVTLSLRVDRLDKLGDGSLLVIDYKTGAPKALLDRTGEPNDLQLVVYAAAMEAPIGGIAIVDVASSGIRYRGIGSSVEWTPLAADEWSARLQAWTQRVDDAIAAFAEGDVRVDVARPADEARPLALLSRVEELRRER